MSTQKGKEKDKDKEKEKEKLTEIKKQIPQNNNNISDIIAKNIFEKILSLTITKSSQNDIEKKIPNFCFKEIKDSLEQTILIDFLNYEKDDIKQKRNLLNYISKSHKNLNFLKKSQFLQDEINLDENLQKKVIIKNKSEKLKKYKFHKKMDPNYSFETSINLEIFKTNTKKKKEKEKEKSLKREKSRKLNEEKEKKEKEKEKTVIVKNVLLNGLIIRDKSFDNKNKTNKNDDKKNEENNSFNNEDPFVVNSPEEIENIQKIESHKIDDNVKFYAIFKNTCDDIRHNLAYDIIKIGSNHWDMITQPSAPPIDRDAGTKIKYEKPNLKLKKEKEKVIKEELKENEVDEKEKLKKKDDNNENDKSKKISKKKSVILKKKIENENEQNKRKKKYAPIIEFLSEDLDPKLYQRENENDELQKLRDDLEKEMAEKKLEIANKIKKEKEEQELEKAREEKRKELANKNVTVDIKGELVYIKSLDINQFINDFSKTKSKFKDIKTIEFESKLRRDRRKKTTIIEKNPDIYVDFQDTEKSKKMKSKGKNILGKKGDINEKKFSPNKPMSTAFPFFFDKNREPIVGAGSNFDIMNPVCGVNLTEDKKVKSGGKDFFHKYNKYSIQVFEETLNKTISNNFYQKQFENLINNTINVMSLKKKKTAREMLFEPNKEKIKDKSKNKDDEKNKTSVKLPNEANNKLSVNTKNLKMALNSLDLITEGEEQYLSQKKSSNNRNIIKRKQFILDLDKQEQKDYDEIDKFAKTLVGTENWGENIFNKSKVKRDFRKPKKPAFDELKRELPSNILNHIPRKRLPPINAINRLKENNFGKTMSDGFFNKNKKVKLKSLSTEENKNIQIDALDTNNLGEKKNDVNYTTSSNFYKNTIN